MPWSSRRFVARGRSSRSKKGEEEKRRRGEEENRPQRVPFSPLLLFSSSRP
jgi:hypothetical protein